MQLKNIKGICDNLKKWIQRLEIERFTQAEYSCEENISGRSFTVYAFGDGHSAKIERSGTRKSKKE